MEATSPTVHANRHDGGHHDDIDEKSPQPIRTSVDVETAAKRENSLSSNDDDMQAGVKAVEAAASVWTRGHLITAYALIWLVYFVISTQEVVVRAFSPYVTSSFSQFSLTAAVSVISSIIAGLTKLPLAKILDVWGRPQGMSLMLIVWVVGFIMMAACKDVETYAAAQVFSLVGAQGISYCISVFVADTSSFRNRGLMLAFATSPYIFTTWIGGPISDRFLARGGPGWRWGFGIWAIITPAVVLPLILIFLLSTQRAKKQGLIPASRPRLTLRSVRHFAVQFDLFGILLLAAGLALLLTGLSIWSYQTLRWRAPIIICFVVIGAVLIIVFALYEHFLAPVKFIPMHLLGDRTVLAAGLMLFFVFFNSAVWGSYFISMLMVVWGQSITHATYISNIYRTGSCFSALVLGYAIRRSGRFRWVALYFALPLMILGVGLMIHFRQPDADIGYVVMTQIFVAFAGGPIVIAAEMAMMAPMEHQHLATILAILDLFGSVGYAVGSAVAAAIWTGTFHPALVKHLPAKAPLELIYSSIYSQLGYPMGSPTRIAISLAYGEAQRYMLITSVCSLAAAVACVFFWRDIRVASIHQNKGNVV